MKPLAGTLQQSLEDMFGPRVTFDGVERMLYSHDMGSLPSLVKPLVGRALADGVVQPQTEEQVVKLAAFAQIHEIPLVPRGKATSGYGGVVPVKGGLVVDFSWMNQVLAVDPEAMTATVQPGVVWQKLEEALNKQGLALRTYPSSAPSSTVGGWLAQGGLGFGAYEYGAFWENVVSCRAVVPGGEVREFSADAAPGGVAGSGHSLDLISGAGGSTGLITEVTLRVRPLEPEVLWGAQFKTASSLGRALQAIGQAGLPLWSASFINPTMAHTKNHLPPHREHGEIVREERPTVPEVYVMVFVAPESRQAAIDVQLQELVEAAGGQMVEEDVVRDEWEERFNVMHSKRLGPSVAPTEVVVPLENIGPALEAIERRVALPMLIEGMVAAADGEVTLLGFVLHDERKLTFNFAFGLALTVLKIARENGGRAYSTGLYFAGEAANVLGAERLARMREFKAGVDPGSLLNPQKVVSGRPLLSAFMGTAGAFEPVIRLFGNAAKQPVGERIDSRDGGRDGGRSRRGIPADLAWYAYACAQCGYCVDECDEYYGRGWESQTPRGKWYYLRQYMEGKVDWNQKMIDSMLACTTCEYCNVRCCEDLPIEDSWLKMRGELVDTEGRLTFPPFEIMRSALHEENNIWAQYRSNRPRWMPQGELAALPEQAEIAYFAGCTASYVEQDVAQGTTTLLRRAGVEFTYLGEDESCCGIPMLASGLWDAWEETMRHNIEAMKARGIKTVVTSCPSCWLSWHTYYTQWAEKLGIDYPIEAKHYSQILAERIAGGQLAFDHEVDMKVTWHDSCHMGRGGGLYEEPRQVIQAVPGVELVEMEHNREHAHCCGGVQSMIADAGAAKRIGDVRLHEAEAAGAQAVVASCPCCELQLRVSVDKTGRSLPVVDLANLACRGLGIDYPDPSQNTLQMWSVFEAMIDLLEPEHMAVLMAGLLPEMIEAMPGPFRGMMAWMQGASPGVRNAAWSAMKPMLPGLFPRLLPGLLPRVMPAMLEAVGQRIAMPHDMAALMPDLMPPAMENLVPKMLPLVMPYFMPRLEAYLKGGSPTG